MEKYNPKQLEQKIQRKWKSLDLYRADLDRPEKKYYLLVEFTYPSGDLHMGHWFTFAVPDILLRMKRMQGFNVFAPNGFDAFGLPAENAAIKRGIHPKDWTSANIARMREQFETMGASYDWSHTVVTSDVDYYKWNQWIFLKMFERGLAYKGKVLSNWCPKDQTVLANENVENGKCWRCGSEVVQKEVEQWFFKITDYAEKLIWSEDTGPVTSFPPTSARSNQKSIGNQKTSVELRAVGSLSTGATRLMPDWPKSVRDAQNNWIGESEGIEIEFQIADDVRGSAHKTIKVFTKFPETIFGVTYMVLAPEHEFVFSILRSKGKGPLQGKKKSKVGEIREYVDAAKKKSELERIALNKNKTGVFTGSYCINPINGEKVPVWISDYVILTYGTGAVMGVPGSDLRDFQFAKEFSLPIVRVIGKNKDDQSEVVSDSDVLEQGYLVNSSQFSGLGSPSPAREKIMDFIEGKNWGKRKVNYHLHDWSISRQRYWGTPIPIIYCVNCWENSKLETKTFPPEMRNSKLVEGKDFSVIDGVEHAIVPVPIDQLPIELPKIKDYAPKGKPPLATATDWINVKCPKCGRDARREVETMDTFVDSSWYFLRYLRKVKSVSQYVGKIGKVSKVSGSVMSVMSVKSVQSVNTDNTDGIDSTDSTEKLPWDPAYVKKWMPVDIYFGGAEHTLGHTLYSRFFVKFFKDIGIVDFDEYATNRVNHGVILGPDGARMSKSKGNVVNPDHEVKIYGADAVRLYLAFLGPYDIVVAWNPNGLNGVYNFLQRVWKLFEKVDVSGSARDLSRADLEMMHKTIKKVGEDVANIKFNTAVAALMEWLNHLSLKAHEGMVSTVECKTFLLLLAPFAPHMTEELWQQFFGNSKLETRNSKQIPNSKQAENTNFKSIHLERWPEFDENLATSEKVTLIVQVNGKLRDRIETERGISQENANALALASEKVSKYISGRSSVRVFYVKDKIINFVTSS